MRLMIISFLCFACCFLTPLSILADGDGAYHGTHKHTGQHKDGGIHNHGNDHLHNGGMHIQHMAHMEEVKKLLMEKLGDEYTKPLPPFSDENRARGKTIFESTCAACHGKSGKGDGPLAASLPTPPSDFTDKAHASFYSPRGRLWIIRNGIPNTPMVGWLDTLGEQGTLDVLAYIESLKERQ